MIVVLDALPLSSNGKVDRAALPEPTVERSGGDPLDGPMESLVGRIVADVLGLTVVGADDDVFALGAYSLDIGRMAIRLTAELGVDITPGLIFEHSGVRELAKALQAETAAPAAAAEDSLAGRLGALSPQKRALLERAMLQRTTPDREVATRIPRRPGTGPAPLSATQYRLWFHDQLAPGGTTYNAVVAMWVTGELAVDLLEDAVRAAIDRHEICRTVIEQVGDEPAQRVLADWTFAVERLDAAGDSPSARDADALRLAADVAGRPYDLARDLTLRVAAIRAGDDRYLLAFGEHHIAFDGWSDDVLFTEVSEHYNAVRAGRPAPERPPLPVRFSDFAAWQRRRLDSGALAAHEDYWKRTLTGAPPVLELPHDRPRPDRQDFRGRHLTFRFAADGLAAGVRGLRQRLGATDYMVLVAAWAATLYRWSGQPDIVLGTPMANRNRVELEPVIGFFSNTVPLRIRVDGAQTFADLVRATTAVVLGAVDHQDLPFDRIVEVVAPARDPRVNPLCQVNVRVQSGPLPQLHLDGADVELVHVDLGFARFDLAVELQLGADAIEGYLEYDEALFDEATARGVLDRLEQLIAGAVADPDRPVWDLPQPQTSARRRRAAR